MKITKESLRIQARQMAEQMMGRALTESELAVIERDITTDVDMPGPRAVSMSSHVEENPHAPSRRS